MAEYLRRMAIKVYCRENHQQHSFVCGTEGLSTTKNPLVLTWSVLAVKIENSVHRVKSDQSE